MMQTPNLDKYWQTLAKALPAFSPEQQRVAVAIYRELAKGAPLTSAALADALDLSPTQAAAAIAEDPIRAFVYADHGQIAGFGGLATAPMHHEFQVKGRTLWTWCAWDSLFIPIVLGHPAEVSSPDPATGERVRLTVAPSGIQSVAPTGAVVSFVLPKEGDFDQSAENVMGQFCHHVFFFASRESGDGWGASHPGTVLYSPDEAFELGRRLAERQFGQELRRPSETPAGGRA